ncbi:hypothetical protein B0E46_07690 [Rhodanobacter sp. B04]|uniref:hypothetical protein n=1 Tax=Rhodanobacter sp. B04 TaxID=1945860 RepID=UPI0009852776|nr:hypothetical protein [Rhodanobacter sp. B04]OOG64510.1 hypothetical protein B0E46_07690 [Rhodanobacter sp. B04]
MAKSTNNIAGAITDRATDLIEKVSSPASRAGSAAERAGRMLEEGVDPDVIALQMTKNSPNGKRYTAAKVLAYGDLYEDSKTKAPLPLAWPDFKDWASERTIAAGGKPDFPRDRVASDFVQRMLFQLRADRARSIDNVAFSKALKNALNLKDVHDASAFVRDRIIEERPINISEFRHQLETFRDLKQKIVDVIERIRVGGNVLEACQETIVARMRKAIRVVAVPERPDVGVAGPGASGRYASARRLGLVA